MQNFSLTNKTRSKTPSIPFRTIKESVLGSRYELSVALLTSAEARRVTRKAKGKDKASNVLSFPLSKRSGELLLCPATARREAPLYGKTPRAMLAYLFIHGLLHLKGYAHGGTMEREESKLVKRFGF